MKLFLSVLVLLLSNNAFSMTSTTTGHYCQIDIPALGASAYYDVYYKVTKRTDDSYRNFAVGVDKVAHNILSIENNQLFSPLYNYKYIKLDAINEWFSGTSKGSIGIYLPNSYTSLQVFLPTFEYNVLSFLDARINQGYATARCQRLSNSEYHARLR